MSFVLMSVLLSGALAMSAVVASRMEGVNESACYGRLSACYGRACASQ
jgi:hypothetical protein